MSAKLCKFDCGKALTWDNANKRFVEEDGIPHTTERCKSLKAPKPAEANGKSEVVKMHDENMVANRLLVAAINRMAAAIEGKKP